MITDNIIIIDDIILLGEAKEILLQCFSNAVTFVLRLPINLLIIIILL